MIPLTPQHVGNINSPRLSMGLFLKTPASLIWLDMQMSAESWLPSKWGRKMDALRFVYSRAWSTFGRESLGLKYLPSKTRLLNLTAYNHTTRCAQSRSESAGKPLEVERNRRAGRECFPPPGSKRGPLATFQKSPHQLLCSPS